MLTFTCIVLFGILVGILVGLFPALPVYTGPFLLYYFASSWPLEYQLTFWLVVISGSQFFGSVATITTQIPGEESSLVYLNDLNSMNHSQKNVLLYNTAWGSLIAGLLGTAAVGIILHSVNGFEVTWFSSLKFQLLCYTLAIVSFFFMNKNIFVTVALVALGLLLAPKNNYALPPDWFWLQQWTQGYTFYMLILGLMIIPELLTLNIGNLKEDQEKFEVEHSRLLSWVSVIKSSIIGLIAGLVPGPSASLGSIAAYKTTRSDTMSKITAAETANNAAVITCALPLLMLALPINQNTIIMSNIADLRSITLHEAIWQPSFITGISVIDLTLIALTVSIVIYYFLSTHLIDLYTYLIKSLYHKLKFVMIGVVGALVAVDVITGEVAVGHYFMLLSFFVLIGLMLQRFKISPIPFMFAVILGDKIIWSYLQAWTIYF